MCIEIQSSVFVNEDVVVVWGDPPVYVVVVLLWVVFLMLGKESIERHALLEVLRGLQTFDVFKELKVSVGVYTGADNPLPVDALQLDI